MSSPLTKLAPAAFWLISAFLAFPSQYLLYYLEPGPLSLEQQVCFNVEIVFFYVCYLRSVWTPSGGPLPKSSSHDEPSHTSRDGPDGSVVRRVRWCQKCDQMKPPRAHHCKLCQRCVLKMDHHCPWTANCVAYRTFPHFTRFLLFSTIGMAHLGLFLITRWQALWEARHLASSLGPSAFQLAHLMGLTFVNSIAGFGVFVLLLRTLWCLGSNTTTIEGWEMERHESLLRRARPRGGFVNGPGGIKVRIVRHEFPYDIGIFENIAQGMGTHNPLAWFWPFAQSPALGGGLTFAENDFNESGLTWPPPDPDKLPRRAKQSQSDNALLFDRDSSRDQQVASFRRRQQRDFMRREQSRREQPEASNVQSDGHSHVDKASPRWRNAEGETLDDFGVDEASELDLNDDVPLAMLISASKSRKV